MLEPFFGGLLFHPAALDYSDETCSHGCAYCFANINKSYRDGDLKGAIKRLYAKNDTTLTGRLLRDGYPIVVSNRTDAFAKNNIRNTRALFHHLAERENGIFIQTKGGDGIGEVIESLPRKPVVYISITMLDDDLAKKVEPAAPSPTERLALARYFVERGYVVIAAINPCNKRWLPPDQFTELLGKFREVGVRHTVIEVLDMSTMRMRKLSEGRKIRLVNATETIGKEDLQYVRERTAEMIQSGFRVAKKGQPFHSDFYIDVEAALGRCMPSLQVFVNECFARDAHELHFPEFIDFISRYIDVDVPVRGNALRGYLLRTGFETWKDNQRVDTYRDLFRVSWNDARSHASVQNHSLLTRAMDGALPATDSTGDAILLFNKTA